MEARIEHKELTEKIIGCAYRVYNYHFTARYLHDGDTLRRRGHREKLYKDVERPLEIPSKEDTLLEHCIKRGALNCKNKRAYSCSSNYPRWFQANFYTKGKPIFCWKTL